MSKAVVVAWLVASLVALPAWAGAMSEGERSFLALYFSDEELEVFTATRSLKSVDRVAQNVAIVTAEEIAISNAHTAAEALYNVTGLELTDFKGPGSAGIVSIHGSGRDRVTVLLDGVPLDTANNGFQLATLPVQMIGKIEIVKGPASSSWGSSFGGVINVITKSAERGKSSSGMVSAALGEGSTSDVRAELAAKTGRFGIYLFGGRVASDGLPDAHEFTHENFFSKLSVDAGPRTRVDLSFFAHGSDSVNQDFLQFGRDTSSGFIMKTLQGKAELRTALANQFDLSLSAWWLRQDDNFYENQLSTGLRTRDGPTLCQRTGLNGSLAWRTEGHALVAGADVSDQRFEHEFAPFDTIERRKFALLVNDTITAGDFSVTPGARYDHSSLAGDIASPSLGVTYLASRDLLVRLLVARGFHDPPIVRYFDAPAFGYLTSGKLGPERIWSYEAGLEANVLDLLRAKLSLFYHDIDEILIERPLAPGVFTMENGGRAATAGGEFELATNTFKGFVLKSGAHHERTRRFGSINPLVPAVRDVSGVNATLTYRGAAGLRAALKARYLRWEVADPSRADQRGVVVDFSAAREFLRTSLARADLFASAHNLFDAHSYNDSLQKNPGRWFEVGVRCSF